MKSSNKDLPKNLILFGFKSSGKTHFGSLLAQKLESLFLDTDLLIEELYKKEFHEVCNCRQISLKLGEAGFRALEGRVIESLKGVTNAVIALGGGAVLNPLNCANLEKLGKLVYLEADKETIKRRIFCTGIPSFLNPKDPENSFENMYEARRPIYEKVSSFSIKIEGKTDQQILDELELLVKTPLER